MTAVLPEHQALLGLLQEVAAQAAQSVAARERSRYQIVVACRQLEQALMAALGVSPLRGLKNLGRGPLAFYGVRVRSEPEAQRYDKLLSWDEPVLCLDARGQLVMAQYVQVAGPEDTALDTAPVLDDELRSTDVEALLRAFAYILPRHLLATTQHEAARVRVVALAERISRVVAGE